MFACPACLLLTLKVLIIYSFHVLLACLKYYNNLKISVIILIFEQCGFNVHHCRPTKSLLCKTVTDSTCCPFPCILIYFEFVALRRNLTTGLQRRYNTAKRVVIPLQPAVAQMSSANNVVSGA